MIYKYSKTNDLEDELKREIHEKLFKDLSHSSPTDIAAVEGMLKTFNYILVENYLKIEERKGITS